MFRVSTDALIKHWDCSQDLYSNSLTIPIEWFYSLSWLLLFPPSKSDTPHHPTGWSVRNHSTSDWCNSGALEQLRGREEKSEWGDVFQNLMKSGHGFTWSTLNLNLWSIVIWEYSPTKKLGLDSTSTDSFSFASRPTNYSIPCPSKGRQEGYVKCDVLWYKRKYCSESKEVLQPRMDVPFFQPVYWNYYK